MQIGAKQQGQSRERWLLWLGLLLPVGLLGLILFQKGSPFPNSNPDLLTCGAETLADKKQFRHGDFFFGGGQYQSTEQAHSGQYGLKFPGDGNAHYGLNYDLEDPVPGSYYKASIWRLRDSRASANLVVQGDQPDLFYEQESKPSKIVDGWEEISIYFQIPYGEKKPNTISIYAFYKGPVAAFVDDLKIEKLDYWADKDFQPKVLDIELDQAALKKLEEKRNQALRSGILQSSEDDWVNARITYEQEVLASKIRLKGDWLDHLSEDKWSFRVKLKSPASWRGMTVFSLHTPVARHYLHEWVLHQLWQSEGVLSTRYDFIELKINGVSKGIYAYEEHFAKQLIESQQNREGPILRLSEEGYWSAQARQMQHQGYQKAGAEYPAMDLQTAQVNAFNEAEYASDTLMAIHLKNAKALLTGYQLGQLSPAEVFDLKKLAYYYAICDALRAYHGIDWHNQRFYYNPVSSKLEPIGFDGYGSEPPRYYGILGAYSEKGNGRRNGTLFASLFQDTSFVNHYLQKLDQVSSRDYLGQFLADLAPSWLNRQEWIRLEFPKYTFELSEYLAEADYIQSLLAPIAESSFRAYQWKPNKIVLQNLHHLPLEILGFGYGKDGIDQALTTNIWSQPSYHRPILEQANRDGGISDFAAIRYHHELAIKGFGEIAGDTIELSRTANFVYYRLPGGTEVSSAPLNLQASPQQIQISTQRPVPSQAEDHPSLIKQGANWLIPAGNHQLTTSLVIGADGALAIAAGASIDLQKGAYILSYGPVQAIGYEDQPISISSSDHSGSFNVMEAFRDQSQFRHTHFEGLTSLSQHNWLLTGAVTIFESEVAFEHCTFKSAKSEDALNIIRSEFELSNCLFSGAQSDGFDSDFCQGQIRGIRFQNMVNDGLDLSGSVVKVDQAQFFNCGDKAISVGEDSDVIVESASIENCNIALAAKDYSSLVVQSVSIKDCAIGFAVYQKKPEYGPAKMFVNEYEAEGVRRLQTIAPDNTLQFGPIETPPF